MTRPGQHQKPMPPAAHRAGLEALRSALRRANPGYDVVFRPGEGTDVVDDSRSRQVCRRFASPEDQHALLDRIDVRPATLGATDEDGVDHLAENLSTVSGGKG